MKLYLIEQGMKPPIEDSKQCLLAQDSLRQVSWIPKGFAVKNKRLNLKNEGQWIVLEVWS